MKMDVYLYSDRGGRDHNEDSAAFKRKGDSAIFIVADGLGGHRLGDQASARVTAALMDSWNPNDTNGREAWLRSVLGDANGELLAMQGQNHVPIKSTAVVLSVDERRALWAHVGDSRLYYFHRGCLERYTEDHSVAYMKYRLGEITRDQISRDEDQSRLMRALGNEERCQPDTGTAQLETGDAFLLCSDGIWEYVSDGEMLEDLRLSGSAKHWADRLLARVTARVKPDHDNMTILTIFMT